MTLLYELVAYGKQERLERQVCCTPSNNQNQRETKQCRSNRKYSNMDNQISHVMQLCCLVSGKWKASESWQVMNIFNGLLVALPSVLFTMILGLPQIIVGALFGLVLGWRSTRTQYKSVSRLITQLPISQKKNLYVHIRSVLGMLKWNDGSQLISMVMANSTLQLHVELKILTFFTEVLGANVRHTD